MSTLPAPWPPSVDAGTRHERGHLSAELGRLGQQAQALGRELAVVVMHVDQETRH
jgi:hypothetical protein